VLSAFAAWGSYVELDVTTTRSTGAWRFGGWWLAIARQLPAGRLGARN